jgi:hypothetical protein
MSDKGQGQLIKTATEETDPQPARLAEDGLPAIVQRGAEDQGSGLYAEAEFLAKGRQLNAPARPDEELSSNPGTPLRPGVALPKMGSSSISVQACAVFAGQDAELATLPGLRAEALRGRHGTG